MSPARPGGGKVRSVLLGLAKGGPEERAVAAGEIDAVIDYTNSNVILLPAARRALRDQEAPIANSLLAALPREEYGELLGAGLEPLTLAAGEVLQQPGAPIAHVYFPVDCVISLLATADGDASLQVGLIGYEGMLGISLVLGRDSSSVRAPVQAGGTALRVKAMRFRNALPQCPVLQRGLHRYAEEKLSAARQTIACSCFHAAHARLARWLLEMGDRVRSDEFFVTQALLASLLGVRRATINEAAGPLQERGLISFHRGKITLLDRKRLEADACGCYAGDRRSRAMSGNT